MEGPGRTALSVHIHYLLVFADIQFQISFGSVEIFTGTGAYEKQGIVWVETIFPCAPSGEMLDCHSHPLRHVHVTLFQPHAVPLFTDAGREHACRVIHAEYHFPVLIAGIGNYHYRQGVPGGLSHKVQLVNPPGQFTRLWVLTQDEMADSHVL